MGRLLLKHEHILRSAKFHYNVFSLVSNSSCHITYYTSKEKWCKFSKRAILRSGNNCRNCAYFEGGECSKVEGGEDEESSNRKSGLGIVGLQLYSPSRKRKRERKPRASKLLKQIANTALIHQLTCFNPILRI